MNPIKNCYTKKDEYGKIFSSGQIIESPETKYEIDCFIGGGSFGSVFKAKDIENNKHVSIKTGLISDDEIECLREVSKFQSDEYDSLIEDFTIELLDAPIKRKILVLSYNEDYIVLSEFLRKYEGVEDDSLALSNEELADIFSRIEIAVKNLERNNIFHRDIKPDNILINKKTLRIKLIDFGNCLITSNSEMKRISKSEDDQNLYRLTYKQFREKFKVDKDAPGGSLALEDAIFQNFKSSKNRNIIISEHSNGPLFFLISKNCSQKHSKPELVLDILTLDNFIYQLQSLKNYGYMFI
jgi:serine/threonine protein kinase